MSAHLSARPAVSALARARRRARARRLSLWPAPGLGAVRPPAQPRLRWP